MGTGGAGEGWKRENRGGKWDLYEGVNHMTTVESVVTEIGLPHPIVYDIYDLCDYVKKEKLNYFTVSMLKEFCTLFELPFKSRDSKAVLM